MRTRGCSALVLLLIGCSGRAAPAPAPAAPPAPKPPPTAASVARPQGAGGLLWDITAPLVRHDDPKSPVRAAEYGVDGEKSTELVVFHYGEEKVSVEGQIQGWLIQIEQRDRSETAKKAKRDELTVGPLTVNTVEVSGVYTGPVAMTGVQIPPEQDWILLGAIASGPKGPVMFKLTGPRNGVERARPAFEQLLHSLRPE
jgi:hypothetical protein